MLQPNSSRVSPGENPGSKIRKVYLKTRADPSLDGMSKESAPSVLRHGLTFIATLAFLASFFGSRLFATLFPTAVVARSGIHIHHFWYGIALISAAGWMGIAWRNERLYRLYAVLYGLGAGFLGDEIGLLLTLGNYESELTYLFFVAAISFVIITTLLIRYRALLERDVVRLAMWERVTLLGVFLTGFSVFFAFLSSGINLILIPLALLGIGILALTFVQRKRTEPIEQPKT